MHGKCGTDTKTCDGPFVRGGTKKIRAALVMSFVESGRLEPGPLTVDVR